MSSVVNFDVFDLGESTENIEEIAIVPNLDLATGTQVDVVVPGTGEIVSFTLSKNAHAGETIIIDVDSGEIQSLGEHGVNDAWVRMDTAIVSIVTGQPAPGSTADDSNDFKADMGGDVPTVLLPGAERTVFNSLTGSACSLWQHVLLVDSMGLVRWRAAGHPSDETAKTALAIAKEGQQNMPTNPRAITLLGVVLKRYIDGSAKARKLFERALALSNDCMDSVFALFELELEEVRWRCGALAPPPLSPVCPRLPGFKFWSPHYASHIASVTPL